VIHVFIGTKAQYIKMVPLLRHMDSAGVGYRLIDSGQHAELAASLRRELGVREPDLCLGIGTDVVTLAQALRWSFGLAGRLLLRSRLRNEVFAGRDGVCVVHGDTPSTLLGALLAKRAGMSVAHVEAGLRTFRWFHPFPEEIVRVLTGRMSDVLFAPGPEAASNLRNAAVKGRVVEQPVNTVLEAVRDALGTHWGDLEQVHDRAGVEPGAPAGPAVVTMHRVENLYHRSRRSALVDLVTDLAADGPVRWVVHGPTEQTLAGHLRRRLVDAGVELVPLLGYREFLTNLAAAPFVITDGGSIQEECALLGVPTLVWRDRTDRPDGLGENVVLSHYDATIVGDFLKDPQLYRRRPRPLEFSPSERILAELDGWR